MKLSAMDDGRPQLAATCKSRYPGLPRGYASAWDERFARSELNSFDVTRLVLATLVILEHSYFLIDNTAERDPISILSGDQIHSGQLAVYMFFSLSGFLVTSSLLDSSGILNFIAKRVARIAPGFLLSAAFCCLIVAPLTSNDPVQFFHSQNWRIIVLEALALKPVGVGGVLQDNPVHLVQGTFWTIQYEFDCYLILALIGALGLIRSRFLVPTYIALGIVLAATMAVDLPVVDHGALSFLISSPHRWPELFPFFFIGSAFFLFRDFIPKTTTLLAASVTTIAVTFWLGGVYWSLLFGGTYCILFASLSYAAQVRLFGRRVDLSYGVYLYGWPIEQLLLFYSGVRLLPLELFALAVVLSYVTAWFSWTYVERPSLGLVRNHRRQI